MEEIKQIRQEPYQTEQLNELFGALAKAQLEMEVAGLNSANPFFKSKYSDLAAVVKASRICLAKNGLSVIQQLLHNEEGQAVLHTKLCHSSGQWLESRIKIVPPKNDVQSLGSYITYLRRYSYAALVGVVSSDEDDDGETAMETVRKNRTVDLEKISPEQLKHLKEELELYEDIVQQVQAIAKINNLSDLPKDKFEGVLKWVQKIKSERNGLKNEVKDSHTA